MAQQYCLVTAPLGHRRVYADGWLRGTRPRRCARDKDQARSAAGRLKREMGVAAEVAGGLISQDTADAAKVEAREGRSPDRRVIKTPAHGAGASASPTARRWTRSSASKVTPTRLAVPCATVRGPKAAGAIVNVASVLALAPEVFPALSATKASC